MSASEVWGCVSLAAWITLIVGYWIGYLDGRDSARGDQLRRGTGAPRPVGASARRRVGRGEGEGDEQD